MNTKQYIRELNPEFTVKNNEKIQSKCLVYRIDTLSQDINRDVKRILIFIAIQKQLTYV